MESKINEKVALERMNDPEAASRICTEGMEKWLDQEDDWQLLNM